VHDAVRPSLRNVDRPVRGDLQPIGDPDLGDRADEARRQVDPADPVVPGVGDEQRAVRRQRQAVWRPDLSAGRRPAVAAGALDARTRDPNGCTGTTCEPEHPRRGRVEHVAVRGDRDRPDLLVARGDFHRRPCAVDALHGLVRKVDRPGARVGDAERPRERRSQHVCPPGAEIDPQQSPAPVLHEQQRPARLEVDRGRIDERERRGGDPYRAEPGGRAARERRERPASGPREAKPRPVGPPPAGGSHADRAGALRDEAECTVERSGTNGKPCRPRLTCSERLGCT